MASKAATTAAARSMSSERSESLDEVDDPGPDAGEVCDEFDDVDDTAGDCLRESPLTGDRDVDGPGTGDVDGPGTGDCARAGLVDVDGIGERANLAGLPGDAARKIARLNGQSLSESSLDDILMTPTTQLWMQLTQFLITIQMGRSGRDSEEEVPPHVSQMCVSCKDD